ncbi:hypothetical protein ACPV5U_24340 [Vibrio mediterranei]
MPIKRTLVKTINRKRGVTAVEGILGFIFLIAIALGFMKAYQEISFQYKKNVLVTQVRDISAAADKWKLNRSNYTGLTMTVICAAGQQSLDANTCGGVGGTGANANAFGGNFTLTPAANVARKQLIIASLPTDRISEIADTLAGLTEGQCQMAAGCASITTATDSVTLTII